MKCLYRHLFLEDTCKHERVTKKNSTSQIEHRVMVIRRGGVTDIAWLEIKCLYLFNTSLRCKYGAVIAQLSVLASHKTNFESVAQGA